MIRHVWSRHLPAAPGRAWNTGHVIIVSPGWDMAPCSDWMLAWAPAGCPPAGIARFLEQEWLLRRAGDRAAIAPVAGRRPPSLDHHMAPGAEVMLGGQDGLVLKSNRGHVLSVRYVCLAPLRLHASSAPAVLAETCPLSLRFVSGDRMHDEALHLYIDSATGTWRRRIEPCAAA